MSPEDEARTRDVISVADIPVAAATIDRVGFIVAVNDEFRSITDHPVGSALGDLVAEPVRPKLAEILIDDGTRRSAVLPLVGEAAGLAEFRVATTTGGDGGDGGGDTVVFVLPRRSDFELIDLTAAAFGRREVGVVVEYGDRVVHADDEATRLFGRSSADLIAAGSLLDALGDGERERIGQLVADHRGVDREPTLHVESLVERPDGSLVPVELWTTFRPAGTPRITLIADATDRADRAAATAHAALYDELTDLPNRHLLLDRMSGVLDRMRRRPIDAALCVLDLDGFKPVNDELGDDVGDEVLRIIASRLKSRLRPSDTVARIGGDEFAVLFDDTEGTPSADALSTRLRDIVTEPIVGPDWDVEIDASVGTVVIDDARLDPIRLLELADRAMYEDKSSRR